MSTTGSAWIWFATLTLAAARRSGKSLIDQGGHDCIEPATTCDPCATSSCPGCEDCVGACVPAPQ